MSLQPRPRIAFAVLLSSLSLAPSARAQATPEPAPDEIDPAAARIGDVAGRSVVVVRCGDARVGTAFAFDQTDRVVTARHVADCPRPIGVERRDGRRARARVAAVGEAHDVAILVLEEPLELEPLAPRETPAVVGLRVFAVGWPVVEDDERVGLTVTGGVVGQVSDDLVYADVTPVPGSSGGPLLDVHGRVVGVVFGMRLGSTIAASVPAAALERLADAAPDDGGDVRSVARPGYGLYAGVMVEDDDTLGGFGLQLSLELWDQLVIRGDFGAYLGQSLRWAPQPMQRNREVVVGSLSVGYRFRFELGDGIALTLTPEIGFSLAYDRVTERSARFGFADPTCDPSSGRCEIASEAFENVMERWRPRPTFGLRVGFADFLELGYQLQLDVENPGDSLHQINIGIRQ